MSIELLNKLKELGLFQYILEIIDSEDLEFAGNEIDIISEYKYLQI